MRSAKYSIALPKNINEIGVWMNTNAHLEGFEREKKLKKIWHEVQKFQPALYMWRDFMKVAEMINPDLCEGAFTRRTCRRKLRYIGHDDPADNDDSPFVLGETYDSVDFNGATYIVKNSEGECQLMGCAYFGVLNDQTME